MEIILIPLWLIGSVLVSAMADNRGQSGIVAFFVAFIMSPILMGLIVLCRQNFKREEIEAERQAELLEAAKKGGRVMKSNVLIAAIAASVSYNAISYEGKDTIPAKGASIEQNKKVIAYQCGKTAGAIEAMKIISPELKIEIESFEQSLKKCQENKYIKDIFVD